MRVILAYASSKNEAKIFEGRDFPIILTDDPEMLLPAVRTEINLYEGVRNVGHVLATLDEQVHRDEKQKGTE
jgi:hypothetical protein